MQTVALVLSLFSCASASATAAVDKVTPGELIIDHPTLINLGFEWRRSSRATWRRTDAKL